ncbi:MAG: DUF1343 domain-containing protein, partial [Myxococcales bacterium]|nr:DUF1343 domain-containing protein [Myxococcales bacterium]
FQPTFHKHAGMLCGGVQVHIVQPASFRPYEAYLRLIAEALMLRPEGLMPWRTEPYEFVESRPAIDLLTGGPEYRQAVNEGASLTPLLEAEREGAHDFFEARKSLLRYR